MKNDGIPSMRGGARPGSGRKPVEIDVSELEKLCLMHATDQELAAWFRCTTRTIEKRRKDPAFAEVLGGVWKNSMSDAIWDRLQAVWDRRGWDGISE